MNTNAIDKIIKKLSYRDYISASKHYPESFKRYNAGITTKKPRNYYQFSYSLGIDTQEAIDIKKAYISQEISENEYKAYCLRFNLSEVKQ